MLQGLTMGHNHNVIHAEYGDGGRAQDDVKCWPEVAGTLGSGRQTSELCLL